MGLDALVVGRRARAFGVRAGARRRSTAFRRWRSSKHFFVGPSLSDHVRRPRILHGQPHHRRALRRRPGLLALMQSLGALVARQVGDPGERPHRAPDLRAHPEQRPPRLADDRRRAGRRRVQHREPLRHHPRLQPADRRAAQRHRREHDRPPLVRARVLPRRLVEEPRHRRVRLRPARAGHRATTGIKFDPLAVLRRGPERPERARLRQRANGYLDVTTKVFATPQTVDTPYGTFPLCAIFAGFGSGTNPSSRATPPRSRFGSRSRRSSTTTSSPRTGTATRWTPSGGSRRIATGTTATTASSTRTGTASRPSTTSGRRATSPARSARSTRGATRAGTSRTTSRRDGQLRHSTRRRACRSPTRTGSRSRRAPSGCDVHRDTDHDGTEDECEFTDANGQRRQPGIALRRVHEQVRHAALRADDEDDAASTTVPPRPPDLFASTAQALNSWNIAVKRAVQLGKVVEATRVEVNVGSDATRYLTSEADLLADQQNGTTVPDIFVLCHNPVIAGDDAVVRRRRAWPCASAISATTSSTSSRIRSTPRRGAS